jgi:hypothetical protein
MKNVNFLLVIAIMTITIFSSCRKYDVAPMNNPQPPCVGNGCGGYGNTSYNQTSATFYVFSKPVSAVSIPIFDQFGNQIGIVDCTTGDWKQCNAYFQYIQNWNYFQGPCPVLVQWDTKFTTGSWSGHIIG